VSGGPSNTGDCQPSWPAYNGLMHWKGWDYSKLEWVFYGNMKYVCLFLYNNSTDNIDIMGAAISSSNTFWPVRRVWPQPTWTMTMSPIQLPLHSANTLLIVWPPYHYQTIWHLNWLCYHQSRCPIQKHVLHPQILLDWFSSNVYMARWLMHSHMTPLTTLEH
jgi:hypothetical protein